MYIRDLPTCLSSARRPLEIQLPGTLFVTIFEWFPFRLKQLKTIETARWELVKGDRDRLMGLSPQAHARVDEKHV